MLQARQKIRIIQIRGMGLDKLSHKMLQELRVLEEGKEMLEVRILCREQNREINKINSKYRYSDNKWRICTINEDLGFSMFDTLPTFVAFKIIIRLKIIINKIRTLLFFQVVRLLKMTVKIASTNLQSHPKFEMG